MSILNISILIFFIAFLVALTLSILHTSGKLPNKYYRVFKVVVDILSLSLIAVIISFIIKLIGG